MIRTDALHRLSCLVIFFCAQACAEAPRVTFNIPAGDAPKTLATFYGQTKIEMLYLTDKVRGAQTNAVVGTYEASEALDLMLRGTGLEFSFREDFSFVSINPSEKASTEVHTVAREQGAQRESEPSSSRYMFGGEADIEEVVVTGTLIRGVLDVMSPLTVVPRAAVKRVQYAAVADVLQNVPIVYGGGPSEDFATAGNYARGTSINLRGLGAGATLVLLNGRRLPVSGNEGDFIDVSTVPWAAVDRIEVLPDGASALYGADAIAGVVNIITRSDSNTIESVARMGTATGGAAEKLIAQLVAGSWNSGGALFSYQYAERSGLSAVDRSYAASSDKRPLGGSDFRTDRSAPGNIVDPVTLQPTYGIPSVSDGRSLDITDLIEGRVNYEDRNASLDLVPRKATHSFFLSGSQNVNRRTQLFAEARYSRRTVEFDNYASDGLVLVPGSNPFVVNPYSVPFVLISYNFLQDLGPTQVRAEATSSGAALGAELQIGEKWRAVLTGTHGDESLSYDVSNQVDQRDLNSALADPNPLTAFNPFVPGSSAPETIDAIRLNANGQARSTIATGSLVADGPVFELKSGAAKLAFGAERRSEKLLRNLPSVGRFQRSVSSVFAELNLPLIGNPDEIRKTPRLELSLAGRSEHYSDFGTAADPKIGLRWAPVQSFKVRASFGHSFRAPRLPELYDANTNFAAVGVFRDPSATGGSSVILGRGGVREDLKQETATTWTAGFDIARPWGEGFSLSATGFSINYRDRITRPGPPTSVDILLQEPLWADVIDRAPARDEILSICRSPEFRGSVSQCESAPIAALIDFRVANMARTRVSGLDLMLDQPFRTQAGTFALRLSGSFIHRYTQAVSPQSAAVNLVDTVGFPAAIRARANLDWVQRAPDSPGFGVTLGLGHTSAYRDADRGGSRVGSSRTLDVQVSYRTGANAQPFAVADLELMLSASNILNQAPPFVDREVGYDAQATEPFGRVLSLQFQKKWQ